MYIYGLATYVLHNELANPPPPSKHTHSNIYIYTILNLDKSYNPIRKIIPPYI